MAKESDSDIFTQDIYYFLLRHLHDIEGEQEAYKRWKAAEVNQHTLARWIDTVGFRINGITRWQQVHTILLLTDMTYK